MLELITLDSMPVTVLCDVDGCIVKHEWPPSQHKIPDLLPGVFARFAEWNRRGYRIILTTARTENFRQITLDTVNSHRLPINGLIMDLPCGRRFLINDVKPEEAELQTAIAINLERNAGLIDVDLASWRKAA